MKNKFYKYCIGGILAFCIFSLYSQQTPAPKQQKTILLSGAKIHIGNGTSIEKGFVRIEKGKITYVGKEKPESLPDEDNINVEGQEIYPGFIAPNSTLGIMEIEAVRATRDYRETGKYNSNIRSIIAYNSESKIIETVRKNGVLLAQITPRGKCIAGQSSIVQLDAWNWEDAVMKMDDAMHLYWKEYDLNPEDEKYEEKKKEYHKSLTDLEKFFIQAKNYNPKTQDYNGKYESLKKVFTEKKPLFVHVTFAIDMLKAISFKKKLQIPKMVFVGGYDAVEIAEQLKENQIPVLANRVHELPFRKDDDINHQFILPILLLEKGILVGLENAGDMATMNTRNLPFLAGSLVAYGLDKEKALQTITLNTAKILNIDDKYGSIEVGKSATLFVSEGDALDIRTNQLSYAFIDGRQISLASFQEDLYHKYRKKQITQ